MTDKSYGIIPIFESYPRQYLLIYQAKGYWSFPKGHKEINETDLETAKRELLEETGITAIQLIPEKTFSCKYNFMYEDVAIAKTVTYVLGYVRTQDVEIDHTEAINFYWGNLDECLEKLRHKTNKQILKDVNTFLNSQAT